MRFFYAPVLKKGWSVSETPYPKKILHLAQVLSREEVARLIDAAQGPFHGIFLMTLYATGARRADVAHLKIGDIDSQHMVIHFRGGKGRKDRDVMLSPKLLEVLRDYWPASTQTDELAVPRETGGTRAVVPSPPRYFGVLASRLPNALVWHPRTFILTL